MSDDHVSDSKPEEEDEEMAEEDTGNNNDNPGGQPPQSPLPGQPPGESKDVEMQDQSQQSVTHNKEEPGQNQQSEVMQL